MPRKEMLDPVVQDRENIEALRSEAARLRSEIAEYARRQFKNGMLPAADDGMALRFVRAGLLTEWADREEPDVALRERHAAEARWRERETLAKADRKRADAAQRERDDAAREWLAARLDGAGIVEREALLHDALEAKHIGKVADRNMPASRPYRWTDVHAMATAVLALGVVECFHNGKWCWTLYPAGHGRGTERAPSFGDNELAA